LYTRSGKTYSFDTNDVITQINDGYGNTITFDYNDTTGFLETITDDLGREIALSYNVQDLIETITDFEDRTWRYSYNASKDLIGARTPTTTDEPNGLWTSYS
jgi:YD repeat-containing protein